MINNLKLISKRRKMLIFILLIMIIFIVQPQIVEAVWFDNSKETAFLKSNAKHLVYTDGFLSVMFNQMSWLLVKGLYWSTSSIENLIPQSFSLFKFVNSSSVLSVYKSVINTIVVGLMIISLIIIGYKMVLGKGNLDLKSVGMNIVMSVSLILLMPTMITSGIEFAKVFYKDATSISQSDQAVSWSLIEENVTDLVLINKNNNFQNLNQEGINRNSLHKEYFYQTNFSEVLTDKVVEKMKKENDQADYLNYQLTINSEGQPEAVKISDGFLSMFSDGFKTGYFRYKANFFPIILGLLALAIAYVFSLIVIISSIIELAFKKIIGVLVFATDLETGQKSKMVLSDIMQTFLTIGFQGFGLSMFALFINYLESTQINMIIKMIAYICAVFVLIKGSQSIMRYFGVDIGLKEGYGQLASTLALGAGLARKAGSVTKSKGANPQNPEGEERKPEKNFGESLSKKAGRLASGAGYAKERGISGLASDGASAIGNQFSKPFKSGRDLAQGVSQSTQDGYTNGIASAISKNMKPRTTSSQEKESTPETPTRLSQRQDGAKSQSPNESSEQKVMSSSERMRQAEQNQEKVQSPATQELQQRIIKASEGETDKAREEFIQQRRSEAKYNPEAMTREGLGQSRNPQLSEVQERVNTTGSQSRNPQLSEVQERVNATSGQTKAPQNVSVQEQIVSATQSSSGERISTVREQVNTTGSQSREAQTVDVTYQSKDIPNVQGQKTMDIQTNVIPSGDQTRSSRNVTVQEQIVSATQSPSGERVVTVQEQVNTTGSQSRGTQTVDVTYQSKNIPDIQGQKTMDIQTNVVPSGDQTRSSQNITVQEQIVPATQSSSGEKVVTVREEHKSTSSQSRGTQTVDVDYRSKGTQGIQNKQTVDLYSNDVSKKDLTQKINIVEERKDSTTSNPKKESILVEKEVKEKNPFRSRFTIDDNPLFQEPKKNNPLFNFDK